LGARPVAEDGMYVKTKDIAGHAVFYLCIAEQGGEGGRSWKSVEYSLCLGETLDLSSSRWLEILRASAEFRHIPLEKVLETLEKYVAARGLSAEILAGLRAAVHDTRQKSHRGPRSERRSQEDERATALRVLGLLPGSSEEEIESAFRKAARRHHPDVGGDPAKFRAIVDARNFLLGRDPRLPETV
jgi:hypothetical protein